MSMSDVPERPTGASEPNSGSAPTGTAFHAVHSDERRSMAHPGGASPSPPDKMSANSSSEGDQASSGAETSGDAVSTAGPPTEDKNPQQSRDKATEDDSNSPQIDTADGVGDVPPSSGPGEPDGESAPRETVKQLRSRVWGRFNREKRDMPSLAMERDEMMRLAKGKIKNRDERMRWVYSELDRMYPPLAKEDSCPNEDGQVQNRTVSSLPTQANNSRNGPKSNDDGQIQGLSSIPEGWPVLPSNASMASEVAWVQANRLRVVEERSGKATRVHLIKAHSPAPSWAALGWLETSIRSYAKFVDVAAKVSASSDDEGAVMRRERKSLEEVRRLLDEMMEDE